MSLRVDTSNLDIKELADHELEKMGNKYKCPFHDDSTASLVIYNETSTFTCFGCNKSGDSIDLVRQTKEINFPEAVEYLEDFFKEDIREEPEEEIILSKVLSKSRRDEITNLNCNPKGYRGLNKETCEFFSVRHEYDTKTGEVTKQYYPVTKDADNDRGFKLSGYKIRTVPKKMYSEGETGRECHPFGWFKFMSATGRTCVITAGEVDQLSAFQMLSDYTISKGHEKYGFTPVISSTLGEGCSVQFKALYKWFDGFSKIIVCFDPDSAGEEAVEKALKVLPRGKVYQMKLTKGDTNHYLQNGLQSEWINAYFKASNIRLEGIVGSSNLLGLMEEYVSTPRIKLPNFLHKLEKALRGGIPLGYVVNLMAASGVGKSTFVDSMIVSWIMDSIYKVGIVSLEASPGEYGINLGSGFLGHKVNLLETPEDRLAYVRDNKNKLKPLFEDEEGRDKFYLFDSDVDKLKETIEYLIISLDCKIICLDPIQDVFDAMPEDAQAGFMKWQKDIVKREQVTIVNISHSRKSAKGQASGSRGADLSEEDMHGHSSIYKSGGINIIISRDKENEDDMLKNVTKLKITKARGVGYTGNVGEYYYDNESHTLWDKDDWNEANPDNLIPDKF